ncbi:MAG TPA: ABC transporter permease [Solirubrobacteraceae bacterium]|nr:ABC transporter permease [Solirubrobacteraceae bacterium]
MGADVYDVEHVATLLAPSADPQNSDGVQVSRPTDALQARAAAQGQFTTLLLGLGAVALLVGAIGIANIMVISVLERRGEIGLRRALGATRRHARLRGDQGRAIRRPLVCAPRRAGCRFSDRDDRGSLPGRQSRSAEPHGSAP